MKFVIFISLAFASTVANAAIAGFDGLNWGMPRQEIQAHYPNFEEWDESDIEFFTGKQVMERRYGLRSHVAAGCNFSFKLDFIDNKLSRALLAQNFSDDTDCRPIVQKTLQEKYGSRPEVENSSNVETFTWKQDRTTVVFRTYYLSNDKWHVEVIYTDEKGLRNLLKLKKNDL